MLSWRFSVVLDRYVIHVDPRVFAIWEGLAKTPRSTPIQHFRVSSMSVRYRYGSLVSGKDCVRLWPVHCGERADLRELSRETWLATLRALLTSRPDIPVADRPPGVLRPSWATAGMGAGSTALSSYRAWALTPLGGRDRCGSGATS